MYHRRRLLLCIAKSSVVVDAVFIMLHHASRVRRFRRIFYNAMHKS